MTSQRAPPPLTPEDRPPAWADDLPPMGLSAGGDCGPAHQGSRRLGRNDQRPGLLCGRPKQCWGIGRKDVACKVVTLPTPRARHCSWPQAAKPTWHMHKISKGSVCLPNMDMGCMQIGVWRRYLSDARARD